MASFEEAGEKLGQFCVACGWHNVTFEVAEIEPMEYGENVAFALFVEKKDGDSKEIRAFFDYSGVQEPDTIFGALFASTLSACEYDTNLGGQRG